MKLTSNGDGFGEGTGGHYVLAFRGVGVDLHLGYVVSSFYFGGDGFDNVQRLGGTIARYALGG